MAEKRIFDQDYDIYPLMTVKAGETGVLDTKVEKSDQRVMIMDKHFEELNEWNNRIIFTDEQDMNNFTSVYEVNNQVPLPDTQALIVTEKKITHLEAVIKENQKRVDDIFKAVDFGKVCMTAELITGMNEFFLDSNHPYRGFKDES